MHWGNSVNIGHRRPWYGNMEIVGLLRRNPMRLTTNGDGHDKARGDLDSDSQPEPHRQATCRDDDW